MHSTLPEGIDRLQFDQKGAGMRPELERAKSIATHRANLLDSFPNHAALKQPPGSEAEAKRFLESMAKFSPKAHEVASPQRAAPYPLSWRGMDRDKDIEWYGPIPSSGECGAKLISQAEGDFTAYSALGVWHQNNGSSAHTCSVSWTTLLGFTDAGNGPFASSYSQAAIALTVDIHASGQQYQYASKELIVCGSYADQPPNIWYDYDTYGDSGSLSLNWSGDPNATFSVWASVVLRVRTWGPAGAQANLKVLFNDINPG